MDCQYDRIRKMVCKQGKWEPGFKEIKGAMHMLDLMGSGGGGGVMEVGADDSNNP